MTNIYLNCRKCEKMGIAAEIHIFPAIGPGTKTIIRAKCSYCLRDNIVI